MRVIGIDPGLADCGYGVVDVRNRKAEAVDFGCWHTEAGSPTELRLLALFNSVGDLLRKYQPDVVALEESYVGRDRRSALAVGQVRGAIAVACAAVAVDVAADAAAGVVNRLVLVQPHLPFFQFSPTADFAD